MAKTAIEGYQPKNYHKLAHIMQADSNLAIFKRFDDISALRLLSLQADILRLRREFTVVCQENDESSESRERDYSRNFGQLQLGRIDEAEQARLMDELFKKLDEYYRCMAQVAKISKMRVPNKHQFKVLQEWLNDEKGGNNFLGGFDSSERDVWCDGDDASDYVTPSSNGIEGDALTSLICTTFSWMYAKFTKNYHRTEEHGSNKHLIDEEYGLASYRDSSFEKAARVITAAISSVLPVLTIYVLNILDTTEKRVGFTAGMTALFAVVLTLLTAATRAEIFSATAAFAAIEVVYIGTVLGKS